MNNEKQELDYSYENFSGTNIQASEPKAKTFSSTQGTQTYHETPLLYNYGTSTAPIIDQCFIEFPAVTTNGGIVYQSETKKSKNPGEENYNKETYSMMFVFDLKNSEIPGFLGKMDELHHGVAQAILPWKGKIGLRHLDPKNPEATGLKNPVFYKLDQITNERVKGRNPSIWVKLNHWKNNKTLFTDLNGTPIDWSLLNEVEATMVPLMHVEKVYSGATTSIQFKMVSAVIIDIAPLNTRCKQVSTVEKYKQKYSGLAEKVASQLAQVSMAKQDSLDHSATLSTTGTHAKLSNDSGQMHQVSTGFQGQVDKLNEFLGAAPSLPSVSTPVQLQTMSQTLPQTAPQTMPQSLPQTTPQLGPIQTQLRPQPVQFGNSVTVPQPVLQIL